MTTRRPFALPVATSADALDGTIIDRSSSNPRWIKATDFVRSAMTSDTSLASNSAFKAPVRLVSRSNIALTGTPTITGVVPANGNRVAVAGQTDTTQNGIYIVNSSGAWTRADDFGIGSPIVKGTMFRCTEGGQNANKMFYIATDSPVIGSALSIQMHDDDATVLSPFEFASSVPGGVLGVGQNDGAALQAMFDYSALTGVGFKIPDAGFAYLTTQPLYCRNPENYGSYAALQNPQWDFGNATIKCGSTWPEAASATVTLTIASPCVVTKTAHGLPTNARIWLTNSGGALPTGLAQLVDYYVNVVDANTFTLSVKPGGTPINTSGSQSGTHTLWYGADSVVTFGGNDQDFSQYLQNCRVTGGVVDCDFKADRAWNFPFTNGMHVYNMRAINFRYVGFKVSGPTAPVPGGGIWFDKCSTWRATQPFRVDLTNISYANPVVFTCASHSFGTAGTRGTCAFITAGTPADGAIYDFEVVSSTQIKLLNVDATGWNPTTTATRSTASKTLTAVGSVAGFAFGSAITGTGIPAGTYVTAVGTTTLDISNFPTSNGTSNVTGAWNPALAPRLYKCMPSMRVPRIISSISSSGANTIITFTKPHQWTGSPTVHVADLGNITYSQIDGEYTATTGGALTTSQISIPVNSAGFAANYNNGLKAGCAVEVVPPDQQQIGIHCENCDGIQTSSCLFMNVRRAVYMKVPGCGYNGAHAQDHTWSQFESGEVWTGYTVGGDATLSNCRVDGPFRFAYEFDGPRNSLIGCATDYGVGNWLDKYACPVRLNASGAVYAEGCSWKSETSAQRLLTDCSGNDLAGYRCDNIAYVNMFGPVYSRKLAGPICYGQFTVVGGGGAVTLTPASSLNVVSVQRTPAGLAAGDYLITTTSLAAVYPMTAVAMCNGGGAAYIVTEYGPSATATQRRILVYDAAGVSVDPPAMNFMIVASA